MLKPRNWTEDDLFRLKEVMDRELLGDHDGEKMEARLRQAIAAPANRRAQRLRRRLGPLAAGAAALCVAGLVAGAVFRQGGLPGLVTGAGFIHVRFPGPVFPVNIRTPSTSSNLWTQGFAPTPATTVNEFAHVNSVDLYLGNSAGAAPRTVPSVDNADLNLTGAQRHELYTLLKSSKTKPAGSLSMIQSVDFPFQITLSVTVGHSEETGSGYYSPSGAMVLGGKLYAPNPGLAQLFKQTLLSQLVRNFQQAGKVLPKSPQTAALGFVRNLGQPQNAYHYCVPDMVFIGNTGPASLAKEASAKDFANYRVVSTTYGPGRQTATVVLRHPYRFWASPMRLSLVHLDQAWLVIQAGSTAGGASYSGMPPIHAFGAYKTLIIGAKVGAISPALAGLTYTAIPYSDLTSPAYQTARIFIYERQPRSLRSTQWSAAQALKSDPAFQKAADEARVHHGVLVVAGGADSLLSRSVVSQALGGTESTTGMGAQPATWIAVWFVDSKQALFTGGTVEQVNSHGTGGQSSNYLAPPVMDQLIHQATLLIDTWGTSFFGA